ncbi:MAG: threonine synthase [Alphaproteobacteria bacterium]|nr:threonine synthase [Alphaproteobacteria bacterium]
MKFVSTRGDSPATGLSQAMRHGVAPDGGLYLPESLPRLGALDPAVSLAHWSTAMLAPFFEGDVLAAELPDICAEAFDFPTPLVAPDPSRPGLRALELFHGPTGAFKDFGARFLLACFDRIGDPAEPLNVLVATSGDTGGAVGCAAEGRSAVSATILYPRGRVSAFQERQLTCWAEPVRALEVEGDFDDCQRLVKAAFARADLSRAHRLTSANSINIGRLMPQMAYLAAAAARVHSESGVKPGLIIPTGNLGHGFAALYARAMGMPIGPIVLVTNSNRTLADWHRSGDYAARASVATIANAMDVGAPSNFERLIQLDPDQREVDIQMVDDDTIRSRVVEEYRASGYIWCPHSATAAEAYARLSPERRSERPWVACATAHPYKFADIVEPLIGAKIAPPPALEAILSRETRSEAIPATLQGLASALERQTVLT